MEQKSPDVVLRLVWRAWCLFPSGVGERPEDKSNMFGGSVRKTLWFSHDRDADADEASDEEEEDEDSEGEDEADEDGEDAEGRRRRRARRG